MPSFDEVGFLSDELGEWTQAAHGEYGDAFQYAYRANGMALRVMKSIPLQGLSDEMIWAVAAFARALAAFQNTVLMIERGALGDARALARARAETVIVAKGLVLVPGTLDILREEDANHDIKALDHILRINSDNPMPDAEALKRFAQRNFAPTDQHVELVN